MGTKTNDNIMKKYHGRFNVDFKPSQIYNNGPFVVKYTGYIICIHKSALYPTSFMY